MIKRIFANCLVLALLVVVMVGFSFFTVLAIDFPKPAGHVNDFAGIFSDSFRQSLETELTDFEETTTVEIAVVTIKSLEGNSLEDYAVRLFEDWQIGKKEKDNGLLLLLAINERKVRIEVGYGLEPVITDGRAGRIIREEILPNFKKGDYEQGTQFAIKAIKNYLQGGGKSEEAISKLENNFPLVILIFIFMVYLSSFWGRSKRIWPGGIAGAILGTVSGWLIGSVITTLLFCIFFGMFGFFLDWLLSRNYKKLIASGKPTSWWRSGGGFFSGGGGGFGGGSSGGGGASGSW